MSVRSILAATFLAVLTAFAPAQEPRLSNMSIRAQAGGSDLLIVGFTIGPGASKKVLVRAVGPTLGAFGVAGTLADPKLTLFNGSGTKIAENDNFDPSDAPTFASVGAFQLANGAKDAALVATLAPGGYTAQVSGVGGSKGVTLVEVYEVSGGETRLINLSTRAQVGTGDAMLIPGITVSPGGGSRRLLIRAVGPTLGAFGVPGTISDPKLELFSGSTRIASNDNWETQTGIAGGTSAQLASVFTSAGAFPLPAGSKDAALLSTLDPGSYTLQVSGVNNASGEALVEVYDVTESNTTPINPASNLFFAQIRPSANASGSLASGFAAISFASDGTATISVNISNLSSAQTSAYLRLAGTDDYLVKLPLGQIADRSWTIGPIGIYSRNDIVKALNEGRIYVSLDTAKYPAGEAVGTLLTAAGSMKFTAPATPPSLTDSLFNAPSDIEAARLLTQATFGPTDESIAEVKRLGVRGWIDAQMKLPQTIYLQLLRDDATRFPNPTKNTSGMPLYRIQGTDFDPGWWKLAVTSPDQLRHRMAFALSQIFVINADNGNWVEPYAAYYDTLGRHAFGNFRELLESVSLNPEMAVFLTFLFNQKADPVKGTSPDENYAREIQQLFTVGLVQLHPDGTLMLDSAGAPIPTYNNTTIAETAKVFTGWAFDTPKNNFFYDPSYERPGGYDENAFFSNSNGRMLPLKCYDAYHDKTEKRVLSLQQLPPAQAAPTLIPPNRTGAEDLKVLLDTLFNHPNVGPFISRQLIQRFVTSNPSPGYVYRVAQVFANNGRGTRGDLATVLRTILTDYEARSPEVVSLAGYGKLKEPVLRLSGLMRTMKTAAPNGRYSDAYLIDGLDYPRSASDGSLFVNYGTMLSDLGQSTLHAPSVFNFFSPFFTSPGPLADAGLVAPELQIVDSSLAVTGPNLLVKLIYRGDVQDKNAPSPSPFLRNDFTALQALSSNPTALVDKLDALLCAGNLSATARRTIEGALNSIAAAKPITNYPEARQRALAPNPSGLAAPKISAFDPGSNFTIEGWVFPTSLTSSSNATFIAGKRVNLTSSSWYLFDLLMNSGGKINLEVSSGLPFVNGVPSMRAGAVSSVPLVLGKWSHVAGTYDGTTLRVYIDGSLVAQNAAPGIVTPPDPDTPFGVGEGVRADGTSSLQAFNGFLSQVRLWKTARGIAQIQAGMKEAIPSDKTGLIGNWILDESSGTVARDTSGNGYDLTARVSSSGADLWPVTDGTSVDRVRAALHMVVISPDSALQK